MWRLWLAGKATMTEIQTILSLDDVDAMNRALDIYERSQAEAGT